MTSLLAAQRIHIIGIGGAGMSPLALVLLGMGKSVSGSDLHLSSVTAKLAQRGIAVSEGHRAENVQGVDLVVTTSAAHRDNVEIQAARQAGIPVVKGSQLLGAIMDTKKGIAVAGTHGKTTTTAMIAMILEMAGLDPAIVVGGEMIDLELSGKSGRGELMVAEADEYDERFLQLRPHIAVITNIDADHLDFYGSMGNLVHAFERFAGAIAPGGYLVACAENERARWLADSRSAAQSADLAGRSAGKRDTLLYGFGQDADCRAIGLTSSTAGGYNFNVGYLGENLGRFETIIPGRHNVLNALAAITVSRLVSVPVDSARNALASFHGTERRFEIKGERDGVTVVDDYAHHPAEIVATLAAARSRYAGRRIVAVHQPHTYSRLRNLIDEFAQAFVDADSVFICDIYAARETDDLGVHSRDLVARMRHADAHYAGGLRDAAGVVRAALRPGDVLITLGAGDVNWVGAEILRAGIVRHD